MASPARGPRPPVRICGFPSRIPWRPARGSRPPVRVLGSLPGSLPGAPGPLPELPRHPDVPPPVPPAQRRHGQRRYVHPPEGRRRCPQGAHHRRTHDVRFHYGHHPAALRREAGQPVRHPAEEPRQRLAAVRRAVRVGEPGRDALRFGGQHVLQGQSPPAAHRAPRRARVRRRPQAEGFGRLPAARGRGGQGPVGGQRGSGGAGGAGAAQPGGRQGFVRREAHRVQGVVEGR